MTNEPAKDTRWTVELHYQVKNNKSEKYLKDGQSRAISASLDLTCERQNVPHH